MCLLSLPPRHRNEVGRLLGKEGSLAASPASATQTRGSSAISDSKVMGKGGNNVAKHSKLPPSKRKPQGDYSKKVIENVAFWKKHKLNYTAGSKSKSKACTTDTKPQDMTEESYVSLRYLDQLPVEHYLTMSQGQAKKLLLDKQVLAHKKETFLCWECGFPMTGDDPVRCSNAACEKRPRLLNPQLAFTPLLNFVHSKEQIDYKEFVCICFAMGAKLPQDSAIQFVRSKGASLGTTRHRVDKIYGDLRVALAWMEHRLSLKKEYSSAVVEPDSCRTGSSQRGAVRRHLGRTLVLTPRGKRTWSSFALPPSASKAKGRGMGAEKISEITKPMERVKSNCIVAPDGGPAFKSVAKKQGHALLGGVSHIRHIFTPVAKLGKKTLTEGQVRTLRKQATLKRPAAKERCRDWIMPSGDNKAESVLSHIKQGMRRQQVLGRGGKQPPEKRNVQAMAASALLRTCGIDVVLQAVADYRRSCASGIHKVNPRDCFKNVDWLYELTQGQA